MGTRRFEVSLGVVVGPDTGKSIVVVDAEAGVGSAEENALVMTDPEVAPHHFVVQPTRHGLRLRSLVEPGRTRLAGCGIESALVAPGAEIEVGLSLIRVHDAVAKAAADPCDAERFGSLVGRSDVMRRLFAALERLAQADTTVLIEGETGTGKTNIARVLHERGDRAAQPFVVVDCASLPPTLIESELFGHERGAYTGARHTRVGAFESARGGTVLLDEIGELPLELQAKLLRAVEERRIRRVGGTSDVVIQARMIAATNRDLRCMANEGLFRCDLYHRLDVVRFEVPPLRDRPEDIEPLVCHFYRRFVQDPAAEPPYKLIAQLCKHRWRGNVRELRNAVERAVIFGAPELWQSIHGEGAGSDAVTTTAAGGSPPLGPASERASLLCEELPAEPGPMLDLSLSYNEAKERLIAVWERRYVEELLDRTEGNVSRAARLAGMNRTHLQRVIARCGYQDESRE